MRDAAEVRALWPTLSPRERDALVAEAEGWVDLDFLDLAKRTGLCGRREHAGSWGPVPHYLTRWEDAGPLLEALERPMLRRDVEGWSLSLALGFEVRGRETPQEAIALAFILTKLEEAE